MSRATASVRAVEPAGLGAVASPTVPSALPDQPGTVALPPDEAGSVRAIAEQLGLPGIVDVHTHFMPGQVMAKVWSFFDAVHVRTGRPWPIAYRLAEHERVERLRELSVIAFTSMIYPHKPGMAAWLNDWAAGFARATPGCLQTATFYPEPSAAAYVPAAIRAGARVFKAHVQVGDYDPTDPLLDPVWDALEQAQVPTVIHAGSGPAPGRFTGPARIATVLARHPRLQLTIAHMGLPEYAEFLDLAEQHPGVMLDTTMAFTDFTERMHPFPTAERARLLDLADRVLFGSDFPNIPYPYLHAVESLVRLDLGDEWLRAALHDNAAALFDLG